MPKLAIDIEARFAQAMDALDQLGRKADQQAKGIEKSFKGVENVITAVFSAAVIGSLAHIGLAAAEFKKLSEQMGDTAEAISGLKLASDLSGVSLDTVSQASARLASTLAKGGKAADGAGQALAAVGIKLEDFKKASPVAQMEQIALALAKFEDGSGKAAVAMQLFGRAGAALLPFFNDLAEAGGRQAGLTQEQILAVDEYTKSVARLKNQFQLFVQSVAAEIIPAFNEILSKYNELRSKKIGSIDSILGAVAPGAALANYADGIDARLKEQDKLIKGLENPNIVFRNDDKWAKTARARIKEITDEITEIKRVRDTLLGPSSNQLLPATDDPLSGQRRKLNFAVTPKPKTTAGKTPRESEAEKVSKWLDHQVEAAQKYNLLEQTAIKIDDARVKLIREGNTAELATLNAIEEQLLNRARDVGELEKIAKLQKEREEFEVFLAQLLDTQTVKTRALADSYRDLIDPVAQYWRKIKEIDELQGAEGGLTGDEADKARAKVIDQIYALDKTKEKVQELDEFTKQAARNMQDAFADFLFDPFKDGMDGLLKKFSETIRKMLADALAAKLMNALLGDFGKTGEVGGIIGGLFKAGAGYGESGGATEPVPYLGGQTDYGSAMATKSVAVNQTIQFNGGGQDASSDQIRRMVKQAALSAVSESRARNGVT